MPKKNYYEVLEVEKGARREEIERAYNDLMKIYSFDSQGTYSLLEDDQREDLLNEITEAYKVLSNDLCRREYDQNVYRLSDYKDFKNRIEGGKIDYSGAGSEEKIVKEVDTDNFEGVKRLLSESEGVSVDGRFLKSLRETGSLSVKDMAEFTKLNSNMINFLEEADYSKLPGRTYVLGFVKLYLKVFTDDYEKYASAYVEKYDTYMRGRNF